MGTKKRSTLRNNNRDERRGDFFRDDFDDEEEIRGGVGVVCIRDDEYDDDDASSNDDCEGEFRRRMRKTSLATSSLPKQEARRLGRAPLDIIIVVAEIIIIIVLDDDDDDGQESRRRAARRRYRSRDCDRRERRRRKRRRFVGAFSDDKSGIERNGQSPIYQSALGNVRGDAAGDKNRCREEAHPHAKKKLDIIALVDERIYSRCTTTTTADGRRNERVCSGTRVRRETVAGGGGSCDEVVTKETKRGDAVGCQATRRGGGKDGDKDCDDVQLLLGMGVRFFLASI